MANENKPSQLGLLNQWASRETEGKFYTPNSTESNADLTNAFKLRNVETAEPVEQEQPDANTASLAFERAQKAIAEQTQDSVTSQQTKYNLNDLEDDEQFQSIATRFLKSMNEDDDIFEYLRDSDYRVSSALYRGYQSGKWTEEQKADYAYLRSAFDNADVDSTANRFKATADGIIDFVTDPIHLLTLALTPLTGGIAAVAGTQIAKLGATSLGARIAQSKALKAGIKKLSADGIKQGANYGVTEGIVQGTGSSIGNQNIEVNANLRDSFSAGEAGLSGLIGGTAGGVLGLGGAAAVSGVKNSQTLKRVLERNKNREQEPKPANAADRQKEKEEWDVVERVLQSVPVQSADRGLDFLKSAALKLTGKATSPLLKFADDSKVLQDFLKRIRYDAFKDFSGKTLKKVTKSFGLALGERTAKYRQELNGIFANLERTGWTNHLTAKQNEQLSFILQEPDVLSKVKLTPVKDADGNITSYNVKIAGQTKDQFMASLNAKWRASNPIVVDKEQKSLLQQVFGEKNVDRYSTEINIETIIAARRLQRLSDNVFKDARLLKDVDGKPLKDAKGDPISLLEENQKTRNFFPRFWNLQGIKDNREKLVNLLRRTTHSDLNDEYLQVKYLDKEILEKEGIKEIKDGAALSGYKQDEHYFRKYFDDLNTKHNLKGQKRIDTFKKAAKFFDQKGELTSDELIEAAAKKLKSERLVQDVLDQEFPGLSFVDYQNPKPLKHQRSRAFGQLVDQDLIDGGFIENNVEQVWVNYFDNMAGAIERERYLGSTLSKFESRFVQPLERELTEQGKSQEYINNIATQMRDIYEVTTGTRQQKNLLQLAGAEKFTGVQNFLKLTQQLAHLPLATISSLTEPLIILSKVGIKDTPAVVNAFASAAGKQMKKSFNRFFVKMDGALKKAGVHNRSVKSFKDLTDDEWAEAYTWSIATQYSAQERLSSMFASSVTGKKTGRISEAFFSLTLLSPWTQAVQFGAFKSSKSVIQRLTKELSEGKLSASDKAYNIEKLWSIGISPKKAVNAYRKSSTDGVLDETKWTKSAFYQNDVLSSSNLFAREIILNPSASEANKPLWFNSPTGQLVMQFASYPTVFNNTIMKGMVGEIARDPIRNAPKVAGAAALMTGGAILTNAFRSEGRSLEESDERIAADAISRWGGFGPLDYGYRYAKGMEYGGMTAGSTIKAPFGPLVADVVDSIQFRHSPLQIGVQNLPFYSALPKEQRDSLKAWARGSKKSDLKKPKPMQFATTRYAKGGRVNVPNAVEEPEERKMRGLPLTYSDMGGPSVQDKEDRMGFAEGGEAEVLDNNNYAESVLTKNDDYGYILEDVDPIETYEDSEMPKGTSKESYFVSLQTPNYHEINKKVEDTLGMDVSKSSVNHKGNHKIEGKIKLVNTLEVDAPTPESIYNKLKEIRSMPDDISLLKDMKFELDARDDVIKNSKTLEKSKSVIVKDTLFNLGYDSISYNNGKNVVLLKTNQFIPTKIEKNIIRKKVYGGGLSRTLRRRYDIGGAVEAVLSIFAKIPLTKKFLDIQHSRMGIEETDKETFAKNLVRYADEIADIESGNNPKEISSADAKGLHQFKDETVKTVVNNFISGRIPVDKDIINAVKAASKKDPRDWNRDESNLMVLGHMFLTSEEKTYNNKTMSTDPLLRIIGTAKEQDDSYKQAAEFLYMKFHWRGSETSPEYNQALKNVQDRYNPIMSFKYDFKSLGREDSFATVTEQPVGVRPMPEDKGFFNRLSNFYQTNISDAAEKVAQDQTKNYDYNLKELMKPEPTEPPRMGYNLPYPRQAEQDAYEARERAKLKDLWMPLADGSLKYDNYPSITQETGINYPDMYDAPPAVADPELYSEILPAPKKDWKGGMRKHSRTSDYREPYVVGGLVKKLVGKGGILFDYTNPLDYLAAIPGLGVLGIGSKTLLKLNKLPKQVQKQYHGGYSSVEKGAAGKVGIYSTPKVSYASAFRTGRSNKNIEKYGATGLYKLDLSKAKNVELIDKPSKKLQEAIQKEKDRLINKKTLTEKDNNLLRDLERLFTITKYKNRKIRPYFPQHQEGINFLRKKGVEILTTSKDLKNKAKPRKYGTEMEYFLLKDFPKVKLTEAEENKLIMSEFRKNEGILGRLFYNEGGEISKDLIDFLTVANEVIEKEL